METKNNSFYEQAVPLLLTLVVLAGLIFLLLGAVNFLNSLPIAVKISPSFRWDDIFIGAIVYLKTSVDFAIFMGRLMSSNPGWKNRVAIEIGTAIGNAAGTILILALWIFFKDIHWLLALMILIAALVLLELAYTGLEHFVSWEAGGRGKKWAYASLEKILSGVLRFTRPAMSKILPDLGAKLKGEAGLPWRQLLWFSVTVPFLLGLDDFAGYVPLFSIVNVLGFSVGVLAAHTALNVALFINPGKTTKIVRNEWVSFLGTLAFVGLAVWGLVEVVKIFI